MRSISIYLIAILVVLSSHFSQAQTRAQGRQYITFQGRLLRSTTPITGQVNLTFRLPGAGWTEQHENVNVVDGYYAVVLGKGSPTANPLPTNLFTDSVSRKLQVRVNASLVETVDLYAPFESDVTVPTWVRQPDAFNRIPGRPQTIDTSNTNELQTLSVVGGNIVLSPNGGSVPYNPSGGSGAGTVYGPFNVIDSACRIRTQNTALGVETFGNTFWQSFTAPISGRICAVQFSFSTPATVSSVNVRIFAGQGNTGNVLDIFPGLPVPAGRSITSNLLNLPRQLSVSSGAIYTVEITTPSGTNIGMSVSNDTYASGISSVAGRDLTFGVSLRGTNTPNFIVDGQGTVGIGAVPTTNAQFPSRLQVDGRVFDQTGAIMPVGSILPFGGDTTKIPPGWLFCNGTPKSRTLYPDLFEAIGTNWGVGDGVGTFNMPDLRGYFMRGWTNNTARDPDSFTARKNNPDLSGPDVTPRVGTYQRDAFKSHTHLLAAKKPAGVNYQNNETGGVDGGSDRISNAEGVLPTGGSETRPLNAYVHYIIKY